MSPGSLESGSKGVEREQQHGRGARGNPIPGWTLDETQGVDMQGLVKKNWMILGTGAACALAAAPWVPVTSLKWPWLFTAGPAVVKTGLALKFLTVTAVLAGAGVVVYGLATADLKGTCRKSTSWLKGVGRDDEWECFFDEDNGGCQPH